MPSETVIAIASGVQALATVVLVAVTLRYVSLTAGILRTSQAHLKDARDTLDASLRMSQSHLLALVTKIDHLVSPLPPTGVPIEQLRRSGCWTEGEEAKLLELAARVGSEVAVIASRAIPALTWLRGLQERIANSNPTLGVGVDDKTNLQYHGHRHTAATEIVVFEQHASLPAEHRPSPVGEEFWAKGLRLPRLRSAAGWDQTPSEQFSAADCVQFHPPPTLQLSGGKCGAATTHPSSGR